MRHRRLGRVLGRSPSHRKALFRNLVKGLILTEDPNPVLLGDQKAPKVKGRIITTIEKAKEVRPFVERAITIAKRSAKHAVAAAEFGTTAERGSQAWQEWRQSDNWKKWAKAIAPVVTARRRVIAMLGVRGDLKTRGDKRVLEILFDVIAPRYAERAGGYTRILRLAKPRLGDAGTRAILEFVGNNDRGATAAAPAPSFEAAPAEGAKS